jgi:hypothetical protein
LCIARALHRRSLAAVAELDRWRQDHINAPHIMNKKELIEKLIKAAKVMRCRSTARMNKTELIVILMSIAITAVSMFLLR